MNSIFNIEFCYDLDTLIGKDVVSILKESDFIVPTEIYVEGLFPHGTHFNAADLEALKMCSEVCSVELKTDEGFRIDRGNYLSVGNVRGYQQLFFQLSAIESVPKRLLDRLACIGGFRAGHCHNGIDTTWQGEFQIDHYKSAGRPYEDLPQVWDDVFEIWNIDISGNPARREIISDMGLQAAWRMWFGEGSFKRIPKESLLSFRDADVVTTLPCGTVFIQLFDDPLAYDTRESRRRQQAFRDHVDMDGVIERSNNEIGGDCHSQMQEGNFQFGGKKRMVTWLDDKGRNVLRSRATQKRIQECTEDWTLIKEWNEPASPEDREI